MVRFSETSATTFIGIIKDVISSHLDWSKPSTLFVVENISASLVEVLGSHFGVEYEFSIEHVSGANWFRLEEIGKHLPASKSI